MATKTNKTPSEQPSEKLTSTIRSRVEREFKERVSDYCDHAERSESWVVRRAVQEFLERRKQSLAA